MSRLIICGGGLSGSLAAIAIAKRRPEIDLLLLETGDSFGGNHIWSFFDSDISPDWASLIDQVVRSRWPDHEIRFPKRERLIPIGYNSIRSSDLDIAVRAALRPDQFRLGAAVRELGPRHVVAGKERIDADCVIDARGPGPMPGLELGWQKFVGRVYRFARPHEVARPVIMDATVQQTDGFRFLYLLPLARSELLIEDTYYSAAPTLDRAGLGARLDAAAESLGCGAAEVVSEEAGVLPVVINGTLADLWPQDDPLPRLGLRGGFFHPTTGYSLADALANAVLLSEQRDISAEALNRQLRGRAEQLWNDRRFFQLLNRLLFRAAEPEERYEVLEHFYRLAPEVIARFYAARLTTLDKLRILSGKPPVPLKRALSALRRNAT